VALLDDVALVSAARVHPEPPCSEHTYLQAWRHCLFSNPLCSITLGPIDASPGNPSGVPRPVGMLDRNPTLKAEIEAIAEPRR
jgi:hypothetical protein